MHILISLVSSVLLEAKLFKIQKPKTKFDELLKSQERHNSQIRTGNQNFHHHAR